MTKLTKQECLFIERVAAKMIEDPTATMEEAAERVCHADARIVRQYFALQPRAKAEFDRRMSDIAYETIRERMGVAK